MKELFSLRRTLHGKGPVLFSWSPLSTHLASVGINRKVFISDRNGQSVGEFVAPGSTPVLSLAWSYDGSQLAVLVEGTSTLLLWSLHEKRNKHIDIGAKDPTMLVWSKCGPQLAIGTNKGNLFIYNAVTMKSTLIQGKHTKKIVCGAWNAENKLALASLDRFMSINEVDGSASGEQLKLKYDPISIQFAAQKTDNSSKTTGQENTVSINLNRQSILLYNVKSRDNPVELAFQTRYGNIVSYKWYGDGYILIGFNRGWVITISTHMKEVVEELQSLHVHSQSLTDIVYSSTLNKFAVSGNDGVTIIDMGDWKDSKLEQYKFSNEEGEPERMEWSQDGQILTVSTNLGNVFNFLMNLPLVLDSYGTRLVYLSSLCTLSIVDVAVENDTATSLNIAVEPNFVALGSLHVAVCFNDKAMFYQLEGERKMVNEQHYLATISQLQLNDKYVASLCKGRIYLHHIVPDPSDERNSHVFPENDNFGSITGFVLTKSFLVFCSDRGAISQFYLDDWGFVNEFKHVNPISAIWSNNSGTQQIFFDSENKGFVFSPIDDSCLEIVGVSASIEKIIFDPIDNSAFFAVDAKVNRQIVTYSFVQQSIRGPYVQKVGITKLPVGFVSSLYYGGSIHGLKSTGQPSSVGLTTHDAITSHMRRSSEKLRACANQMIALNRLKAAWEYTILINSRDIFAQLARKAMEQLDVDLAICAYRMLNDTAMVYALENIHELEEKNLLAAYIFMLQHDYNKAQGLFLLSTKPLQALRMRRDLLHWDYALKLASSLAPEEIPYISRDYAQQLEARGEYQQALRMYEQAATEVNDVTGSKIKLKEEHQRQVDGCIMRVSIRLGDLSKVNALAKHPYDKDLQRECAAILESMKQYSEAADLYKAAEQWEKAASLYLMNQDFNKAEPLLERIATPRIHLQFAKFLEAKRSYANAAKEYEKANDYDSVVRMYLNYLNQPEPAFAIVRSSRSPSGANLIARYCEMNNNTQGAIEFLLLAQRSDDAFALAKKTHEMDIYADAMRDNGTHDEYLAIATYYEDEKRYGRAAKYFGMVGDYTRALKLLMESGSDVDINEAISLVSDAQGSSHGDMLVRQLHDYLFGETDGRVKDVQHLLRFHIAIHEYSQAANDAISYANILQISGNYTGAHYQLLRMHRLLEQNDFPPPRELYRNLLLLHSYLLAKRMSKSGDHDGSARMLIRVAHSISKFPKHIVPILTSTVIECQRAGLKRSSFEWATVLMRREYRDLIDPKYRKPIEAFVRRPQQDEAVETMTPCPYCEFDLPITQLNCPGCHNTLPYCVTTGRHMVRTDWTNCPNCLFPTLYSHFIEQVQTEGVCCMCNQSVKVADVRRLNDPSSQLQRTQASESAPETVTSVSEAPEQHLPAVDIEPRFD